MATITASSGGVSATATVIVGEAGPSTVVVPSSAVYSATDTQATIASSAASGIAVGRVVVSGDQAGLLGRVTAISTQGTQTNLTLSNATLADAFPNASFNVVGAPETGTLSIHRGVASLRLANGQVHTVSASALQCSGTGDPGGADIAVSNQSLNWNVTIQSHVSWSSSNGSTQNASISAELNAQANVSTGDITISNTSSYGFTCKIESGDIPVPIVALGPLIFSLTASTEYGITGDVSTTGSILLPGPTFKVALQSEEGIAYSNGAWSVINSGGPTGGVTRTPPSNPITLTVKASGDLQPYAAAHISASVSVGRKGLIDLVTLQFLTPEVYGKLDFSLNGSISATSAPTYRGPIWHGIIGASLTFDPSLSGTLPQLLERFGIALSFTPTTIPKEVVLVGSPTVGLTEPQGQCELNATISDSNPIALDYSGATVDFWLQNGPSSQKVATATVSGTVGAQTATASWTPPSGATGPFDIVALVYDNGMFGALGLPYTSGPVSISGNGCGPKVVQITDQTPGDTFEFICTIGPSSTTPVVTTDTYWVTNPSGTVLKQFTITPLNSIGPSGADLITGGPLPSGMTVNGYPPETTNPTPTWEFGLGFYPIANAYAVAGPGISTSTPASFGLARPTSSGTENGGTSSSALRPNPRAHPRLPLHRRFAGRCFKGV